MAMRQRKTRGWTTVSSSQQKPQILFVFLMRTLVLHLWGAQARSNPGRQRVFCGLGGKAPASPGGGGGGGVSQDSGGHLPYLPHLQVEKPETERGKPIPCPPRTTNPGERRKKPGKTDCRPPTPTSMKVNSRHQINVNRTQNAVLFGSRKPSSGFQINPALSTISSHEHSPWPVCL